VSEIQAIIRQIASSVAFLPLIRERCSFDLLVYTDKEVFVPSTWEDSDPRYIANAEEVRLRSMSTKVGKGKRRLLLLPYHHYYHHCY